MNFDPKFREMMFEEFPSLDRGKPPYALQNIIKLESIVDGSQYKSLFGIMGRNHKLFFRMVYKNHSRLEFCSVCGKDFTEKFLKGLKYCGMICYKKDPIANEKLSIIKSKLYSDNDWKQSTELKKRKTTFRNHGVEYPAQSLSIREKQTKSSYQAYDYRGYKSLRGNEKYFVDYMIDVLGYSKNQLITGSDALKLQDLKVTDGKSYRFPDFFLKPSIFIEIKSNYTFEKDIDKTSRIYNILDDMGFDYHLIIIDNKMKPKFYNFENKTMKEISPYLGPCVTSTGHLLKGNL